MVSINSLIRFGFFAVLNVSLTFVPIAAIAAADFAIRGLVVVLFL
jgi:hypothetical protein